MISDPGETFDLFADVAFPLAFDSTLTYRIPPRLYARAMPGVRVLAPLRSKTELGFIVAIRHECALETVRDLLDVPDDTPVLDEGMIRLCAWIADYYCCALGEALNCAVPAAVKTGPKCRYHLEHDRLESSRFSDLQRIIVKELFSRSPLTEGQLRATAGGSVRAALKGLVKRGVVREEEHFREGTSILTETRVRLREDRMPDTETLVRLQRRAPKQSAVYLDLLHGAGEAAATALYHKHGVTRETLRALEKRGWIECRESELYRVPDMAASSDAAAKHALNPEQQAAYEAVCRHLANHSYATFLLHGITGSGKTEVYLQTIEAALATGRSAIMLVPEISLTPQTVGRFYARFRQNIAVLHSGLSNGERYDAWRRAARAEVRIVVGARSAVFAPLPDLGMIVVDEEHDTSYKQNETPRYHARDIAIVRARMNRAVCILGSATPSVESYRNSEIGKSTRIELLSRATSGTLPRVQLVDMRAEKAESDGQMVLSRVLEQAVKDRTQAGEQVILLLNRRGFAPVVLCPLCGWIAQCADCLVSLTYHSADSRLRCHYCNETAPRPEVCGECGFNPLIYLGAGTQKAEAYLMAAFPGARVARMDADTTSGKGGHARILGRFAAREIDILIGTQMLAKGHDYPAVTLVGVINADAGLTLPDFRAAEQAFQLLTQVAGRAGRGERPGEVYIQTYRPKHYAVQAAAAHDYAGFYRQEIEHRRNAGYPPFRRMVNFLLEAEDPVQAERESMRLRRMARDRLTELGIRGMALLGPAPATIRRVKKMYRWNFAILSADARKLNLLARELRTSFRNGCPETRARLKLDLDPYGMF